MKHHYQWIVDESDNALVQLLMAEFGDCKTVAVSRDSMFVTDDRGRADV